MDIYKVPFTLAYYKGKYRILNGQHRYKVIKSLYQEGKIINDIILEIFTAKNRFILKKLYKESNCLVKEGATDIVTCVDDTMGKLIIRFPDKIRPNHKSLVRIDSRAFRVELEKRFKKEFDSDQMFTLIDEQNDEMMRRPYENLRKLTTH